MRFDCQPKNLMQGHGRRAGVNRRHNQSDSRRGFHELVKRAAAANSKVSDPGEHYPVERQYSVDGPHTMHGLSRFFAERLCALMIPVESKYIFLGIERQITRSNKVKTTILLRHIESRDRIRRICGDFLDFCSD